MQRYLSKQMKIQWDDILTVDYLNKSNCWITLHKIQSFMSAFAENSQILISKNTRFLNVIFFILTKKVLKIEFKFSIE